MGAAGGRLTWNLMGMMNNPHYRVKVHAATTPDGLLAMRFEHPCLAGGEAGGCAHKRLYSLHDGNALPMVCLERVSSLGCHPVLSLTLSFACSHQSAMLHVH